jgi:dTDP-4-amino-4,6-dideoxygalactose transaminase
MIDIKRELADIGGEIKEAIAASLEDTIFIKGPRVKEFEKNAALFLGVKHAIGVANGTDALHLALRAIGVREGDEVITTAFTFFATAEACAYIGAKPVFADIDIDSMNINPALIEKLITKKTKAILPVHIFGCPADMTSIMNIAEKHKLLVLEDCAQSFGALTDGIKTGAFGTAGAISFYPTKNLGAYGDAGMVVTNDDTAAELCRKYSEHGCSERYYHEMIGYNSRLDDIQAAVLNVKLRHIDRFNTERRRKAAHYIKNLGDAVLCQRTPGNAYHVYHQFTVRVKNREEVIKALSDANAASSVFYPVPCHLQNAMKYLGYKKGDLPLTEMLSEQVLSLPINPYITDGEINEISNIVKSVAESA